MEKLPEVLALSNGASSSNMVDRIVGQPLMMAEQAAFAGPASDLHFLRQRKLQITSMKQIDQYRSRLVQSHTNVRAKRSKEIYDQNLVLLNKLSAIGRRKAFAKPNDINNVFY